MLAAERSTQLVGAPLSAGAPTYGYLATPAPVVAPISRSVVVIANQKSSGLAAVLSFFWCGLGQIYNDQILKGVGLMISFLVCLYLGWILALVGFFVAVGSTTPDQHAAASEMSLLGIGALMLAGYMRVYGMIDAYRGPTRSTGDK
jgi:TM2 domain-containing membrane protein YozV